jgi:hypothetical protein
MRDRRKVQGEWYLLVLGAVELRWGRELNKIDALIKLIILFAGLSIWIKSFVCRIFQPIALRFPGAGGYLSP